MKSDIRPVPAVTSQNEISTRESAIDVHSLANSTANEYRSPINSLEMNSKLTRDILQSRQSDNQLADLGSLNEYLAHKKHILIDRFMALLDEWLDKSPAFARHAQEGPASAPQGAPSDKRSASSANDHAARGSTRQKRALKGDEDHDLSPDGDGNGEEKRGSKRSRIDAPRPRPFACPFFKKDPSKHKHKQACTGPGWPTISRLKYVFNYGAEKYPLIDSREHIYRCHWEPYKCLRCYNAFQSVGKLEEHQRADEPCRKSNVKNEEGTITEAQNRLLRKKPSTAKTNNERWEEVYRIVFPEAKDIPSPCREL